MTRLAKHIQHSALPAALLALAFTGCHKQAPPPAVAATSTPLPVAEVSAQEIAFVQSFYDTYVALEKNDSSIEISSTEDILRQKPEWFDPALLKALKNDAAIQAKAKGEIDGLDFDPFLASQEGPLPHYKATTASGNSVAVIGYDQDAAHPPMSVTVLLNCQPAKCVIANVSYPAHDGVPVTDLLGTLALLHPVKK